MKRTLFCGCALALLLSTAGDGRAEPTGEDKAAAESLFQDALKLITLNNYPDACPKLESSNKLDPAFGTLFNLGDCYEHTGRTASAWSSFGEARRFAERTGDKRAKAAAEREKALEPKLARLVVQMADKPAGLVIKRDKKVVDDALLGGAFPVDPGKHTIEAEAPGHEPWTTTVDVPDRPGNVTITIPPLAAARSGAPIGTATASPSSGPETPPSSGMSGRKTAGLVVGGVGVAGLIAGGVFGGLTLAKVSESKQNGHCTDGKPVKCDPLGLAIRKDGETMANVSNVAFAVGGAALIAGVVIYLTAPSQARGPTSGRTVRVAPAVGQVNGLWITGSY